MTSGWRGLSFRTSCAWVEGGRRSWSWVAYALTGMPARQARCGGDSVDPKPTGAMSPRLDTAPVFLTGTRCHRASSSLSERYSDAITSLARVEKGDSYGFRGPRPAGVSIRVAPPSYRDLVCDRRDASARVLPRHPCRHKTRPDDRRAGWNRSITKDSSSREHHRRPEVGTAELHRGEA